MPMNRRSVDRYERVRIFLIPVLGYVCSLFVVVGFDFWILGFGLHARAFFYIVGTHVTSIDYRC